MTTLTKILFISIGLFVFGGIPYLMWIVSKLRRRRNFIYMAVQIFLPCIGISLLLLALWVEQQSRAGENRAHAFGVEFEFGKPVYEYKTERSFNGDGYILSVYELPQAVREKFLHADAEWLQQYPVWPDFRAHWSRGHWEKSPLPQGNEEKLDFALGRNAGYIKKDKAFNKNVTDICAALQGKDSFFAIAVNTHTFDDGKTYQIMDIDLFVIDMEHGMVYIINNNT